MSDGLLLTGRNQAASVPPHLRAKAVWRDYTLTVEGKAELVIGISASFTADSLIPMLGTALLDLGLRPTIQSGHYNQIFQTCLDHRGQFDGEPDVVVLLWRIEELLALEFSRYLSGDRQALDDARSRIDELARALGQLRQSFSGSVIVSLPPLPQGGVSDLLDLDHPLNAGLFHRVVSAHAAQQFSAVTPLRLIDLDALQRSFGAQAAFDPRKWYLYKQPYSEGFLCELGAQLARIVRAGRVAPPKCVVLDCDNTLWGGVVGEDGIGGIELGEDFPGSAFCDLQRLLLHWRSQGTLLALASKNNEADVWEVFEQHEGMLLKKEHLSAWRINWSSKADSLVEIAEELRIGVDSLVFIDDSGLEIEQVRRAQPSVIAIQLHDDPARMVEQLKRARLFDRLEVTAEDAARAEMIASERTRTTLGQSLSKEEFAAALGIKADLCRVSESQIARVAQLINKTNQFNLTTIRKTPEEVRASAAASDSRVYALSCSDKFGDYGLVGVAIMQCIDLDRWRIDALLMSCRVLGRDVEGAFLAGLAEEAKEAGATMLEAAFIPTAKNAPAADFLPQHGFQQLDQHRWEIALDAVRGVPAAIALRRDRHRE